MAFVLADEALDAAFVADVEAALADVDALDAEEAAEAADVDAADAEEFAFVAASTARSACSVTSVSVAFVELESAVPPVPRYMLT